MNTITTTLFDDTALVVNRKPPMMGATLCVLSLLPFEECVRPSPLPPTSSLLYELPPSHPGVRLTTTLFFFAQNSRTVLRPHSSPAPEQDGIGRLDAGPRAACGRPAHHRRSAVGNKRALALDERGAAPSAAAPAAPVPQAAAGAATASGTAAHGDDAGDPEASGESLHDEVLRKRLLHIHTHKHKHTCTHLQSPPSQAPPPPPSVVTFDMAVLPDGRMLTTYKDDATGRRFYMDWDALAWRDVTPQLLSLMPRSRSVILDPVSAALGSLANGGDGTDEMWDLAGPSIQEESEFSWDDIGEASAPAHSNNNSVKKKRSGVASPSPTTTSPSSTLKALPADNWMQVCSLES